MKTNKFDNTKTKNYQKEAKDTDENILRINENYAKNFDEKKRHEAIQKAQEKYGQEDESEYFTYRV
jgi:hypothetical protein